MPSATSTMTITDYTYYSTDDAVELVTVTGGSPSYIPYKISLFTNGTNTTIPAIITVDDSTFATDQKVKFNLNPAGLSIWYEPEIKYEFNFKVTSF